MQGTKSNSATADAGQNSVTIELAGLRYEPSRNVTVIMTAEVDDKGSRDGFLEHEVIHADGASEVERNADVDDFVAKLNSPQTTLPAKCPHCSLAKDHAGECWVAKREAIPLEIGNKVAIRNTTMGGKEVIEGEATIIKKLGDDRYDVHFISDEDVVTYPRFVLPEHFIS